MLMKNKINNKIRLINLTKSMKNVHKIKIFY